MPEPSASHFPGILIAQLALLATSMVVLAAWPPRTGRMMLVALDSAAVARMVPIAVGAHALLLGPGPWRRSYVVDGDRATILAALPAGMILTAAPAAGCSANGLIT